MINIINQKCKVGDRVYVIDFKSENNISVKIVDDVIYGTSSESPMISCQGENGYVRFNKVAFETYAEARRALKNMRKLVN